MRFAQPFDLWQHMLGYIPDTWNVIEAPEVLTVYVVGALLVISLMVMTVPSKPHSKKTSHLLTHDQQKHMEAIILDGMETMVILGQITRKQARYHYAKLAQEMGLKGLLPVRRVIKMHPFRVQRLKDRINRDAALGLNRPVQLPGSSVTPIRKGRSSGNARLDAIFNKAA